MTHKHKLIAIYIGIVVLAILAYMWWKKNKSSDVVSPTATTPSTSPTTTATVGPVPVSPSTPAVTSIQNPVTGQTTSSYAAANGSVQVPAALMAAAQADWGPNNYAQFLKMLPQMSGSEIQSLNDLVVNTWGKGANPTPAQVVFWNAWRQKYHIEDGTISNFMGPTRLYKTGRRRK